jgi:hypothetical protein
LIVAVPKYWVTLYFFFLLLPDRLTKVRRNNQTDDENEQDNNFSSNSNVPQQVRDINDFMSSLQSEKTGVRKRPSSAPRERPKPNSSLETTAINELTAEEKAERRRNFQKFLIRQNQVFISL